MQFVLRHVVQLIELSKWTAGSLKPWLHAPIFPSGVSSEFWVSRTRKRTRRTTRRTTRPIFSYEVLKH